MRNAGPLHAECRRSAYRDGVVAAAAASFGTLLTEIGFLPRCPVCRMLTAAGAGHRTGCPVVAAQLAQKRYLTWRRNH